MARQELQRRLEELDMTASEAKRYEQLLIATQAHMASLLDLLERKAASNFETSYLFLVSTQILRRRKRNVFGSNVR